jgi:hypothetical protein
MKPFATVSRRGASDRDRAGLQKGRQASAPGRHAARAWLLLASALTQQSHVYHVESLRDLCGSHICNHDAE